MRPPTGFFPDLVPDPTALPAQAEWQGGSVELVHGDWHEVLEALPADSVTLAMFSPPYDGLRKYGGNSNADLPALGPELYRILKPGGVCVMVIQDQVLNGERTKTSMRITLDWCDRVGFKLFDMLIYSRHGAPSIQSNFRFRTDFEYMPVFLKGDKPACFTPQHMATPAKTGGKIMTSGAARRSPNGQVRYGPKGMLVAATTSRGTIWHYTIGHDMAAQENLSKFNHPATYPDRLAYDHVLTWTEPGDLVVDPFVGSGSTGVACMAAGRCCIGIDINEQYIDLARRRCYPNATGANA